MEFTKDDMFIKRDILKNLRDFFDCDTRGWECFKKEKELVAEIDKYLESTNMDLFFVNNCSDDCIVCKVEFFQRIDDLITEKHDEFDYLLNEHYQTLYDTKRIIVFLKNEHDKILDKRIMVRDELSKHKAKYENFEYFKSIVNSHEKVFLRIDYETPLRHNDGLTVEIPKDQISINADAMTIGNIQEFALYGQPLHFVFDINTTVDSISKILPNGITIKSYDNPDIKIFCE